MARAAVPSLRRVKERSYHIRCVVGCPPRPNASPPPIFRLPISTPRPAGLLAPRDGENTAKSRMRAVAGGKVATGPPSKGGHGGARGGVLALLCTPYGRVERCKEQELFIAALLDLPWWLE